MLNTKALAASASAAKVYVEDVFSTYLYTGNGSTQTITNGIDLSGEGGLVWIKKRNEADPHQLQDTVRGVNKFLSTTNTNGEQLFGTDALTSFNADGFSLGADTTTAQVNQGGKTYVSWTFRQAEKFFDIVTYTGDGTSNRTLSHSLGSVPGCIFLKRTDSTGSWFVYHRSTGNSSSLRLNETSAVSNNTDIWASFTPTSTEFKVSTAVINASGATYVAYLFAHDAGGFGEDSGQNVISCGSFTTDALGDATVTLGWEPQWVLIKNTSTSESWKLVDIMRGFPNNGRGFDDNRLNPNSSDAEATGTRIGYPTASGFFVYEQLSSNNYIYIAIRRGPMKTPTDATKVFYANSVPQADNTDSTNVPFPPDLVNTFSRNGTDRTVGYNLFTFVDRLRGLGTPSNTFSASAPYLISSSTGAENSINQSYVQLKADGQNITRGSGWNSSSFGNYIFYFMRRAPGFFDIVAYTGTGIVRTVAHNLGAVPELMIVKRRNGIEGWQVYSGPTEPNNCLELNTTTQAIDRTGTAERWSSAPTSTDINLATHGSVNGSGDTYIAYLFASCPGVSKVGSYTGTGSTLNIDCGFTNGARFVLIKRTDGAGGWYVWDTARGISSGNDPYLRLNLTSAEVTTDDFLDPLASGFTVPGAAPGELNTNGGQYIFLAIA